MASLFFQIASKNIGRLFRLGMLRTHLRELSRLEKNNNRAEIHQMFSLVIWKNVDFNFSTLTLKKRKQSGGGVRRWSFPLFHDWSHGSSRLENKNANRINKLHLSIGELNFLPYKEQSFTTQ